MFTLTRRLFGAGLLATSLFAASGLSTTGVSAALWASTAPSHYAGAPVGFQVPWGAGPFLVAAREHLGPCPRSAM